MLKDKVDDIIAKNRIDAIYVKDNVFMNWGEVCKDFAYNLENIIGKTIRQKRIAVYPGGNLGKSIVNALYENHICRIECMIDNEAKEDEYKGVPLISYDEWLNNKPVEVVLICSQYMGEAFAEQLALDGYMGEIIDVYRYLNNTYNNLDIIPNGDSSLTVKMWNYMYINKLELKYGASNGKEKLEILKALIYGLFLRRDFCYSEKYIEELNGSDDYHLYKEAMNEVRQAISQVVENKEIENVIFIHIIDSLADYKVSQMPVLKKIADENIRVKGFTVQYPSTYYALTTLLTGKDTFEIELGKSELDWNDSELLRYLKQKDMRVTFISSMPDELGTQKLDNFHSSKNGNGISSITFEGLCCLEDTPKNHMIIIHSDEEAHHPWYNIGSKKRLISIGYEKESKEDMIQQSADAISYVDDQIEWYFPYYNKTGGINLIMGDHGTSEEVVFQYYYGIKKDYGMMNNECLIPAFIISGLNTAASIEGIISNVNMPDIILDLIMGNNKDDLEKYIQEYAIIEAIPTYSVGNNNLFLRRSIYGNYEGFIGIRTKEEIYLLSASGRELYFRPNECYYRNLSNNPAYFDAMEKCNELLNGREFPIEIYALDKFKYHVDMLEKYDKECYSKIMEKLSVR